MATDGYFIIGHISRAKGLKGELQLKIATPNPVDYQQTESVFLELKGKPVPFFVLSFRIQPGGKTATLLLEDIDHIDKAKELAGTAVLLPISEQVASAEAPFSELEGFQVIDRQAGKLGLLKEVIQYPGHSVAAMRWRDHDILFPLNEELIENIDKQNRELFVNLPEGLLDIYLDQ